MFESFPVKAISIILDILGQIGKNSLKKITPCLIKPLVSLETDDLIYLYSPQGDLEMSTNPEEAAGNIINYKYKKINLPMAIKEVLFLVGQFDYAKKGIFVLTDNYSGKVNKLIQQSFILNKQKQYDCKFFFYGIGSKYHKSMESFDQFRHFSTPDTLESTFSKDIDSL